MDVPKHPAISALCGIIAKLPDDSRRTALGFLCAALGQPPDPTGIPFSPDRPIRHMYWDNETQDLHDRLEHLVEKVRLKEQLVVQGAATYLATHFAQWADPTFSQSCTAGFRHTIENMKKELGLPIERRDGQQSDSQINDFIERLHGLIASADSRRQDAEDIHNQLTAEFEAVFTLQFWDALNHLSVERMQPQIDKLLNRKKKEE